MNAELRYFKMRSVFDKKYKCLYCNKVIKPNDIFEELDLYQHDELRAPQPFFLFCDGHLIEWINKQQKIAVLNRI